MATNLNGRQGEETKKEASSPCHLVTLSSCHLVLLFPVLLYLVSCSSIRPIAKIGLIASFEGIQRRNGYEALAAMRAAIADLPATSVDVLPLALDDSLDARRTAQKMLADPNVVAVIGPLTPLGMARTRPDFATHRVPWIAPFVVNPRGGFAESGKESAWATELIRTVAQSKPEPTAGRLFLVGWTPGWPELSNQEWSTITKIDTYLSEASELLGDIIAKNVNDNDLIFWLGNAEEGAHFVNELWQIRPDLTVWSGPQGGDALFAERLTAQGSFHWATWSNEQYEAWAATHTPATPAAYLTYVATRSAILQLQALPDPVSEIDWTVRCFNLNVNRDSTVLDHCR